MSAHITNSEELATTPLRRVALDILQAGLDAIDTEQVVRSAITLDGSLMHIHTTAYDLTHYKRVRVIGFGKAASHAALALEHILGNRITDGAVIDLGTAPHTHIRAYQGTHPLPSPENVEATKPIVEIAESSDEHDLVIVVVSGGGSALLCWPESEYTQSRHLYETFLASGGNIRELNTVRKHLSLVKGGGLARMLYPATVLGLILSDIPGDHDDIVASGPTFFDTTTASDAERIARTLGLGSYEFIETPKDKKLFANVRNITLVSNMTALAAMADAAKKAGLEPLVLSSELYDPADRALKKLSVAARPHMAVLAGGEVSVKPRPGGSGGRNLFMSLLALRYITNDQLFVALASDGQDNGDVAGAIADGQTMTHVKELGLDIDDTIERTDALRFFQKANNILMTGPTGANVSDLYLLLTQ